MVGERKRRKRRKRRNRIGSKSKRFDAKLAIKADGREQSGEAKTMHLKFKKG